MYQNYKILILTMLVGCSTLTKEVGLKVRNTDRCVAIDYYVLCEGMTYEQLLEYQQWIDTQVGPLPKE